MSVYAWCLINNHIHLLLKEGKESISVTLKRIGVSFVGYYNWKYRTTGHLFQDRFKSERVENDPYLVTVVRYIHPRYLLDKDFIIGMFSKDLEIALASFKEFNEKMNNDRCMDDHEKRKLSDDEAKLHIKPILGSIEIAQVKSLPRQQRDDILRNVKKVDGITHRQAARILGVSPNLVFKA